jgi:homoserine/homoserine lactone efflux protein
MTWEILALFAVTETTLCVSPGPAVLLVLSQGLARGAASSIWSNLGILAGNTMYFVLSARVSPRCCSRRTSCSR